MADTPGSDHVTAEEKGVTDAYDKFAELPDAPPKTSLKLTWVGKSAVGVICFWVFLMIFGTWIAPYNEADMVAEDSYLPSYYQHIHCADKSEPFTGYCESYEPELYEEVDSEEFAKTWLGSDYLGRDTLSRIIWGARATIGIALLATIFAYVLGITAGIGAAVKAGWVDMGMSRVNDAILALPSIMLGLIIIAALGSSIPILIGTAGVIYAASVFRIARALGQDIMVQDFVEVARTRGEKVWWDYHA